MRYLFGFACVLGVALLAGCSETTGEDGNGGTGGSGGAGGGDIPYDCFGPSADRCADGPIDPIVACCDLGAPPEHANACTGEESMVNPTSCGEMGKTILYKLTALEVADSCNTGYDLDSYDGECCVPGTFTPSEGVDGVDNALSGLAPELETMGGNLGSVNQTLSDGLCGLTDDCERAIPPIEIRFEVDWNETDGCANVKVISGEISSDVILNVSEKTDEGTACASGIIGTIPLRIADQEGELGDSVVRMTVSEGGLSHGLLGATLDEETAVAIVEANAGDADVGAVVRQAFDIRDDLVLEVMPCNALSATLEIGGVAEQAE
jgi:hypothetical protein